MLLLIDRLNFIFGLTFCVYRIQKKKITQVLDCLCCSRCLDDLTVRNRNSSKSLNLLEFSEENDTKKNNNNVNSTIVARFYVSQCYFNVNFLDLSLSTAIETIFCFTLQLMSTFTIQCLFKLDGIFKPIFF